MRTFIEFRKAARPLVEGFEEHREAALLDKGDAALLLPAGEGEGEGPEACTLDRRPLVGPARLLWARKDYISRVRGRREISNE